MSSLSRCTIGDLVLDSGAILPGVEIAYTTYGALNAERSNAVIVFHALTGDTNVSQWWGGLVGAGKLIDPADDFVICLNAIGSCYGSTGPDSIAPHTGRPYGKDFPSITTRDIARSQLSALAELGIRRARIGIGGSMGAMVLLELALLEPGFFDAVIPIACGASHSAWRIAFSSVTRKTIETIAAAGGSTDDAFVQGMRIARQIGMTSYRCSEEFEQRFARDRREDQFEVEHYLQHQGEKIAARFSPHSYLRLTQAMETYDVSEAIGSLSCPSVFVGIDSDVLYPKSEIRSLASRIPMAKYVTLHANCGHDSFLVAEATLARLLTPFVTAIRQSSITEEIVQ
ncbi:MAG: homoserine O-acetyltransferase [Bacteroidetes bacterium]|nr:homoserine O-acetyltransferase [Bacteroidota bacterium]